MNVQIQSTTTVSVQENTRAKVARPLSDSKTVKLLVKSSGYVVQLGWSVSGYVIQMLD